MFMSVKQIVTIVLFGLSLTSVSGQINRALFVAIDTYPEESGWNDIHATNDRKIVLHMLNNSGFEDTNIICLLNEQATKKAIVKALTNILNQSKAGDYIYIQFSCHGQLMADDNGDEPDGYDESLIPYDARRRYTKGVYEGKNHLRDDELGLFLDKIRAKVGDRGNICVVLDACHSATANRDTDDDTYVRGTTYIFAPDKYVASHGADKNKLKSDAFLAPITVWSACGVDQSNYEYRDHKTGEYFGTLTLAICEVVKNSKKEKITIKTFDERVKKQVEALFKGRRYRQTPYMETTNENKIFKLGR